MYISLLKLGIQFAEFITNQLLLKQNMRQLLNVYISNRDKCNRFKFDNIHTAY